VIIPPILICERRLGDPRVTFIPTQSIYERAPDISLTNMCELAFIEYNPTFNLIKCHFPAFLMSQEKLESDF
jgi:hypothetical protein